MTNHVGLAVVIELAEQLLSSISLIRRKVRDPALTRWNLKDISCPGLEGPMRALVLVILASVVLQSGCSTKTVYRHPEANPERWVRDSSECERDAGQTFAGANEFTRNSETPDSYYRCLTARGWTKTQELDLPTIRIPWLRRDGTLPR